MDASQYKGYILTLLFIKYVTDRFKGDPDAQIEIPEKGGSFDDLVEAKGRSDIGDRINKVIRKLADENNLVGIIDQADFEDDSKLGSGKETVDKLTNLNSFDISSESSWIEWFIGCISFANAPFDYLVILCTNESGEIIPTALQLPKRMLIDIKKAIESKEYSLLEKLTPPYPVDVTAQMLGCFIDKYALPAKNKPDINVLPIGDIAEELWVYSTSKELLKKPEDAVYLSTELQHIQTNVSGMLHSLEEKLPSEDIDQISDACNESRPISHFRIG